MIKRLKKSIPVLAVLFTVAVVIVVVFLYSRGGTYYDYSHLIPVDGGVVTSSFIPIENADGVAPEGMVAAAESEFLVLYIDPDNTYIAVYDKRNGHTWHSNPLNVTEDPIANDFEQEMMRSFLSFRFFNDNRNTNTFWSHRDSSKLGQADLYSIPDGVRIHFTLGTKELGIRGLPVFISRERFNELIIDNLENESDREEVRRWYGRARGMDGFLRISGLLEANAHGRREMVRIFELVGYTYEDLIYDNEAAGREQEDIILNTFRLPVDITLDGDSVKINIVSSKIESELGNLVQGIELMRYFGAGSVDDEGYIFVPSGSGALIDFNNGKTNHERYTGVIYGVEPLGRRVVSQIVNDINLPVYGIKNNNAAVLTIIENGSALATVGADISGRVSSFNSAWVNFDFRETDTAFMRGTGQETSMTIIQQNAYEGDISVRYVFLANEDADYIGMATAYRQHLIDTEVLTPLEKTENAPFYLTMLGAVEKREFLLGTPYYAIIPMTTYSQGTQIIEALNAQGVDAIQAQWMGWFNRGANHDKANKINPVRSIGSQRDKDELTALLQQNGGDLYPAVRFQSLRRDSKRLNQSREVSQDILGYSGIFTSFNRELLAVVRTLYHSDVYFLIHPGAIPFHTEAFISAYRSREHNALALEDLGGKLSQSMYHNNGIDRESSKLIAAEQLRHFSGELDNLMISGGNDYSLFAASHLIDLPTSADRYFILDHSIPFIQLVLHGYIDHSGYAMNTLDVYNFDTLLLTSLATGSAPHFLWSYQPTTKLEFTQYDVLYSTHYLTWLEEAARMYNIYNEIFNELRTEPITDHIILCPGVPGSVGTDAVTMTQFGSVSIYVNKGSTEFIINDITIPPMDFVLVRS